MISLQSKTTIESKTVPGVRFTVRTLNRIQRAKRDLPIAGTIQRLSMLVSEYRAIEYRGAEKKPVEELTPENKARMEEIDREFSLLRDGDVKPADLRAGLVSIEGLEIDGAVATPETLINFSGADYDALLQEIHEACEKAAGLSAAETKNSQSDSTFSAPEGVGPTTSAVMCAGV